MFTELLTAFGVFFLLIAMTEIGFVLQRRLPQHHRTRDSIDTVRLLLTMVVTFAALVLGLLVTSVKSDFDDSTTTLREYGVAIIELDARLRQYGDETAPIRADLHRFTVSVFQAGWPEEAAAAGMAATTAEAISRAKPVIDGTDENGEITGIIERVDDAIQSLTPNTLRQSNIGKILRDEVRTVEAARWHLIEVDEPRTSWPFILVLTLWMAVVFFSFGLSSPPNALIRAVTLLTAISVGSALYVILDLDTRLGGMIQLSSQPIRDALVHMAVR